VVLVPHRCDLEGLAGLKVEADSLQAAGRARGIGPVVWALEYEALSDLGLKFPKQRDRCRVVPLP